METIITPDLMDAYLNQQLTEEEGKAFQEQCNHDATLMEEVRKMKVIAAGVREAGRRRALSMLAIYEKELAGGKAVGFTPLWKWASRFAATLLIAIPAFFFFLRGGDPTALPGELAVVDVERGSEGQMLGVIDIGIKAYKSGSFAAAANLFEIISSGKVYENEAFYYLGMCRMQEGKWKEAKEAFDSSGIQQGEDLYNDLQFYSGIACYQLNDNACVKEKLKPLLNDDEFGKRAKKILDM